MSKYIDMLIFDRVAADVQEMKDKAYICLLYTSRS